MPTYTYVCPRCAAEVDLIRSTEQRDAWVPCKVCEQSGMLRRLAAPMVNMAGHEAAGRKGTK